VNEIVVSCSAGEYPIRFGELGDAFLPEPENAFVVTDRHVDSAWGHAMPSHAPRLVLEPGEASKSLKVFGDVHDWLLSLGADRKSTILAVGGGVIGDLAGFVAATYMRGVRCVQVPTTLLAQVDSSVGGKVAIDIPDGKNVVGAFAPPSEVWISCETLTTLPERQFINGMAEVIKYGLIADPTLDAHLSSHTWSANEPDLPSIVRRCVDLKRDVVERDEFDLNGLRATLNFGHTVGHALEAALRYEGLLHGEAIAIGMIVETRVAERIGFAHAGLAHEVAERIRRVGLPTTHELLSQPDTLIPLMRKDKKSEGGSIAMSLIAKIGECKLIPSVPDSDVVAALTGL